MTSFIYTPGFYSQHSGWGGGYIDEPISKILSDLQSADTLQMDRWILKVERNSECQSTDDRGEDNLPLNVVNNYFSFGVDAQIALQAIFLTLFTLMLSMGPKDEIGLLGISYHHKASHVFLDFYGPDVVDSC